MFELSENDKETIVECPKCKGTDIARGHIHLCCDSRGHFWESDRDF
ncbi:MAG: hypothetical protein F6K48_21840 [Okeania sp. SIO3H1]|nr:hypothetical protein [Okeania sp. SIO3H1]